MGVTTGAEADAQLPVAFVGFGASGRHLGELVQSGHAGPVAVVGVLVRQLSSYAEDAARTGWRFVDRVAELLAGDPAVVVEMAGHEALRAHGEYVLRSGIDLLTISVGAFADEDLRSRLLAAALAGNARIIVPPGAIAGLDAIGAARLVGLDRLRHVIRKPPGTLVSGDELRTLEESGRPRTLYEGPARDAARRFPQNANVVAAVSLAGLDLDRTSVKVVADPGVTHNTHEVLAEGPFGSIEIKMRNTPSTSNPRTGIIVGASIARALRHLSDPLIIGG